MRENRHNLNDSEIDMESGPGDKLNDYSTNSGRGVEVYFRNLVERLVDHISRAYVVVGCVAWLTHHKIIDALAKVPEGVSIVVQKEDFLRPDFGAKSGWQESLRKKYDSIPPLLRRVNPEYGDYKPLGWLLGFLDSNSNDHYSSYGKIEDPYVILPIRCVGNHNTAKSPTHPRMHNKFLAFLRRSEQPDLPPCVDPPNNYHVERVWTGSFNLTANAAMSLENAVSIDTLLYPEIGDAYYEEWAQILALSEPLDWKTPWMQPEWRIGT